MNKIDITEQEHQIIKIILEKHISSNINVFVFGSRAKFTTKKTSDLDIAVQGRSKLNPVLLSKIANDFDESILPFKVDLVDMSVIDKSFYGVIKSDCVKFDLDNYINHNPDILNCLANLSNDEVFTPPKVVNDMLDMLPTDIWTDKTKTFLDPCTKTGVFLREITKRLINGLANEIPDLQERINHILQNQVFGIGITELTALVARRSVYCAKKANHGLSISSAFDDEQGNIIYNRIQHDWNNNGKCTHCGASQSQFDRGEVLETHAYQFIHTTDPQELFKDTKGKAMKFDVIIGNPPYQLSDGGGTGGSAIPLYHKFIQQAKKLNPRFLSMIVPARWYSGGRGLDEFREQMLNDRSLRVLVDFPQAEDCFNGVEIKGGVCYFLWDRDNDGDCTVRTMNNSGIKSFMVRPLLENGMNTFIRFNESVTIYNKVKSLNEKSFADIVSSNDPFGFDVREEDSYKRIKPNYKLNTFKNSFKFFYNGWQQQGIGYISCNDIRKNKNWANNYKIYISKAYNAGDNFPHQILGKPIFGDKNTCCSETYLVVGVDCDKENLNNIAQYISTKFFRFMVLLKKVSQGAFQGVYQCVPMQDFSKQWTDEDLYKKYNLSEEEIEYIESMIKPMEINID